MQDGQDGEAVETLHCHQFLICVTVRDLTIDSNSCRHDRDQRRRPCIVLKQSVQIDEA